MGDRPLVHAQRVARVRVRVRELDDLGVGVGDEHHVHTALGHQSVSQRLDLSVALRRGSQPGAVAAVRLVDAGRPLRVAGHDLLLDHDVELRHAVEHDRLELVVGVSAQHVHLVDHILRGAGQVERHGGIGTQRLHAVLGANEDRRGEGGRKAGLADTALADDGAGHATVAGLGYWQVHAASPLSTPKASAAWR